MKNLYIDYRVSDVILSNLESFGYPVIKVMPDKHIDHHVASHADMNLLKINNKIFATTNVRLGNDIQANRVDTSPINSLYPNDCFLNAVCIGNDFICRKKSIYPQALDFAEKNNMNIIDVSQGYVKCNICVVSEEEKAIITEDAGICETLSCNGYDVLKLNAHCVSLKPYEYGFIGGASGLIDGKLCFTGNICGHAEYTRIRDFCKKHSVELVSLSGEALYDYGSIITV